MPPLLGDVRRSIAASLALLLLGGWASTAVHYVVTTHGVCAEHGEAVHVADAASGGHEHGDGHHRHTPDEPAAGQGSGGDVEHAHCQVLAHPHVPVAELAPPAAVRLAVADEPPPRPVLALRATRHLYRLAPKSSPPV